MFKSWIPDKLSFHSSPAVSYLLTLMQFMDLFSATDCHTVFFVDSREDGPRYTLQCGMRCVALQRVSLLTFLSPRGEGTVADVTWKTRYWSFITLLPRQNSDEGLL